MQYMKPYIPVILATARSGRYSEHVATLVHSILSEHPCDTELIDVRDFDTSHTVPPEEVTDSAVRWRDIATRANAFVIISPEYNHSFPGELKILLDMAYQEYRGKYVATVSVSKGRFGGVRMVEHILTLYHALQLHPIRPNVNVAQVQDWGKSMTQKEYTESYQEPIEKMIQSLFTHIS